MKKFLQTNKQKIVLNEKTIQLKGVNFGGWLLMEGYILHSLNLAEQVFKKEFLQKLGVDALQDFEKSFRDNFICKEDVVRVKKLGANCIRVPFNYRLIEKKPYEYDLDGLKYLDSILKWAKELGVWIILDLHAACGAQNNDWHSDSLGPADLWNKKSCQNRTIALWKFLANRYKNREELAGYDILNEAVLKDTKLLNDFYRRVIAGIREEDKNHIIFVEGNNWAQDIECLDDFEDDNLVLSVHFYNPLEFTFNLIPQMHYAKGMFKGMKIVLDGYVKYAKKVQRPIFVGEFGVNAREGYYGEDKWLKEVLKYFNTAGFHWTYWTYKAIKNTIFPDGVLSYYPNPEWVNRQGPKLGFATFADCWPKHKVLMKKSWRSSEFKENKLIVDALKSACK